MGSRIDLLRRAGLAAGGVAIELCGLAGTEQYHAFHHLAHLGGRERGEHAMRAGRQGIGQLFPGLERQCDRRLSIVRPIHLAGHEHARRQIDASVGDG